MKWEIGNNSEQGGRREKGWSWLSSYAYIMRPAVREVLDEGIISEKRWSPKQKQIDDVMSNQVQVAQPQFAKSLFGAFTMSWPVFWKAWWMSTRDRLDCNGLLAWTKPDEETPWTCWLVGWQEIAWQGRDIPGRVKWSSFLPQRIQRFEGIYM